MAVVSGPQIVRNVVLALAAGLTVVVSSWYHPPPAPWVIPGLVLYAGAMLFWPRLWLFIVPTLLPILDLTPWSGRIFYDEFDLIILTTLALLYLRPGQDIRLFFTRRPHQWLINLLLITTLISILIPLWPTFPTDPDYLTSYLSPYNSIRIGKGFLFAWLLWPHLRETIEQGDNPGNAILLAGLVTGAMAFGLGVLWERGVLDALFNWHDIYRPLEQLLDFSGRYRITGLFSTMQVGGTAVDGYIVTLLPFILLAVLHRGPAWFRLLSLCGLSLLLYGLIVTFSRATYLSAGLALLMSQTGLILAQRHALTRASGLVLSGLVYIIAATAVLALSYHRGGYEAVGQAVIMLLLSVLAGILMSRARYRYLAASALVIMSLGGTLIHTDFLNSRWVDNTTGMAILLALIVSLVITPAGIILGRALHRSAMLMNFSMHGIVLLTIGMGIVIGLGNYRMETRMSHVSGDIETRLNHYRHVLELRNDNWLHELFGEGIGRYPDLYHQLNPGEEGQTNYGFGAEGHTGFLELEPGDFSLSQRLPLKPGHDYQLTLRARNPNTQRATLAIKLCLKHILFSQRWQPTCQEKHLQIEPESDWREYDWKLNSGTLGAHAPWSWPVTLLLNASRGGIEVTALALTSTDGQDLIRNGSFSDRGASWFLNSDFEHLAWHTKQLFLQIWLEQGWAGLTLIGLILGISLIRLTRLIRRGEQAPAAILGTLIGIVALGMVASLTDTPRIAVLFYLILFSGLQWPAVGPDPMPGPGNTSGVPRTMLTLLTLSAALLSAIGLLANRYLMHEYQLSLGEAVQRTARQLGWRGGSKIQEATPGNTPLGIDASLIRHKHPRILLPELAQWDGKQTPALMQKRIRHYQAQDLDAPGACPGNNLITHTACWVTEGNLLAGIDAMEELPHFKITPAAMQGNYGNAWELALAYDLLSRHPAMTPALGATIEARLADALRAYLTLLNQNGMALWHGRATLAANAWLIASVLDPEVPRYLSLIQQAHGHFLNIVKAIELTEAWPEGYNYWINSRAFSLSLAASAYVHTIKDKKLIDRVKRVFERVGLWTVYATRPDNRIEGLGDEGPRIDLKDETRRPIDIITQFTRSPVLAAYSRYLAKLHPHASYYSGYRWGFRLFNDPTVRPVCLPKKAELSCLDGHLPSAEIFGRGAMNQVYIHSDWGPDATFISFRAGASFAHHGHYDAGHFTLFKHQALAVNSSVYNGHVRTPNRLNYSIRSVAKNVPLILRPGETVHPNRFFTPNVADGGQRIIIPTGDSLSSVADWRQNLGAGLHLEGGRILAYRHQANAYTYVAADLTPAYNNPSHDSGGSGGKVTSVTRQLLYLNKEDRLIIHDRIATVNPAYPTKWLLHTRTRPAATGMKLIQGKGDNGILETTASSFLVT